MLFDCQNELLVVDLFFLTVATVAGSLGNAGILFLLYWCKSLRTRMNVFIGNVALVDLLLTAFIIPCIMANRMACSQQVTPAVCQLIGFVTFLCQGLSTFSFMMTAVNRCVLILWHSHYERLFNTKCIALYLAGAYTVWVGFSALIIFIGGVKYIPEAFNCFYYDNTSPFALTVSLTMMSIALPTCMTLICYCLIFAHFWLHRRQARRIGVAGKKPPTKVNNTDVLHSSSTFTAAAASGRTSSSLASSGQAFMTSSEYAGFLSILVSFVVFLLCWGPYSVHIYVDKFIYPVGPRVHKAVTWLGIFNSAVNPIFEGALNSNFRREFKLLLIAMKRQWRQCGTK